jgi:hypothetical protein
MRKQKLKNVPKFSCSDIVWVWDLEKSEPSSGVITDIKEINSQFSLNETEHKQWLYEIFVEGSVKMYMEHRIYKEKENCQNPYIYALGEFSYKIKH